VANWQRWKAQEQNEAIQISATEITALLHDGTKPKKLGNRFETYEEGAILG